MKSLRRLACLAALLPWQRFGEEVDGIGAKAWFDRQRVRYLKLWISS